MMAALNSLSDTFHIWLILSLAQAHCLFLFKLWFLDSSKRLFGCILVISSVRTGNSWILFKSQPAVVLRLVPRLWLTVQGLWCQQQFGFQSACNIILVCWLVGHCCGEVMGPSWRGRASASVSDKTSRPGSVVMGSLLLVLPSCLSSRWMEERQTLWEKRPLP